MESSILFSFFLIFTGSTILATGALYAKQPMIAAYIIAGVILGPSGLKLITDINKMDELSHVGIIFLLFLLGLDMQPQNLIHLLKKTFIVGLLSAIFFALVGYLIGKLFGMDNLASLIFGTSLMFSSTIIGIKLLPTTVLHHKHTGELMVSLLLLQDLLAIVVLLFLYNFDDSDSTWHKQITIAFASFPALVLTTFLSVKYILLPLMEKFDKFREYLFLLALGWCIGMAQLASSVKLSWEIGAFIAGISIATTPIAQFIAINLKPLRDFFLVLFFFSIGASFELELLTNKLLLSIVLLTVCTVIILKPIVFRLLLRRVSETQSSAWEVGCRLAQNSEFSILIAAIACKRELIDSFTCQTIEASAIISMIISSYIVILFFETPLATNDRLHRD